MLLQKFKISLVFLFVWTSLSFSQADSIANRKDSVKNLSEYKLKLNNNSFSSSPLLALKQEIIFDEYSQFIFPSFEQNQIAVPISMMQLKNEMNQTMQIYRQGTFNTDLGFVGKVLGYAAGAAAVGLGAYHVYKYKDAYKIK